MARENWSLMMVDIILVSGKIIKCMDLVNFFIKMVKLHMKGIGRMISFVGKVEFLMIDRRNYWEVLIFMILQILGKNGHIMKESLKMIQKMVKEK
jgi:hypothetical protein